MIRAEFVRRGGRYKRIRVSGHADSATHGEDLVCAGVSTLVQTLLNMLEELGENRFDFRLDSGKFELILTDAATDRSSVAIRSFEIGLEGLAETYPNYVKIKRR